MVSPESTLRRTEFSLFERSLIFCLKKNKATGCCVLKLCVMEGMSEYFKCLKPSDFNIFLSEDILQ